MIWSWKEANKAKGGNVMVWKFGSIQGFNRRITLQPQKITLKIAKNYPVDNSLLNGFTELAGNPHRIRCTFTISFCTVPNPFITRQESRFARVLWLS